MGKGDRRGGIGASRAGASQAQEPEAQAVTRRRPTGPANYRPVTVTRTRGRAGCFFPSQHAAGGLGEIRTEKESRCVCVCVCVLEGPRT